MKKSQETRELKTSKHFAYTMMINQQLAVFFGGGDRSRTGVQTYSPKAFYMFISALFVGKLQEQNKPTISLAE